MIKFYLLLKRSVLFLLLVASIQGFAQERRVTGKVTSSDDGTSLPGVSILAKGSSNGTVTDSDGNYAITINDQTTLVFSFVGFASQEIAVAGQTTINVSLASDVTALNEIVVIGYGQQERKDVTGAVTAITSKDFNRGVLTSPQDLLVGKLAGVQVTTNSGAPGSGATIRIRGGSSLTASNDPLIVIDGFPVDNKIIGGAANPLASLNPNDIESFTVLKDASATAIYGSRASNGVIIITTKKGKDGKPQLSYNGNVSVSTPAKYFDVLTGDQYKALVNEKVADGTVSGLNAGALARLGTSNTDWQKEVYRNAISHDHNLSISGSTGNIPYRVSYGYTDQQGILKTTSSKRNSLNVNLSPTFLDDHLKVNVSAKGSNTKNDFGNTGAVGAAVSYDPTQPVRNGNSRFGGFYTWVTDPTDIESNPIALSPSNPVALLEQTDNTSNVNRLLGNIQLDYRFHMLPELRLNVNTGVDYTESKGINNASPLAAWTYKANEIGGQRINYTGKNVSKLFDIYLNYVKEFGKSKVDLTAGHSYQSFRNDGSNFSRNWDGSKVYDNAFKITDGDTVAVPRQYIPERNYLLSFFGRAQYSFNDKYLFTVSVRNDRSSRFAENTRSGIFPAAAFAWNMSNESFMQGIKAISNVKLRLGYGVTGQQNITSASYPYLPLYVQSTPTAQYQLGSTYYNTYRPSPYDKNLKWEETTTYNAGLDFGLFGGKLTGTIDVYQRKTKDLINNIPVAAGSNFSNFLTTNVGNLENKGFEITLNGKAIDTENVTWNIGFNLTHNVNKITKLTKTDDPTYEGVFAGGISGGVGNTIEIQSVGSPSNSFYVYQQVYDKGGNPIEGLYVDRKSENAANKYRFHSPAPRVLMGINSSVRYKKFDFYFSGRLSLGNYVYNNRAASATYSSLYVNTGFFNNLPTYINDTKFYNAQYFSDYYVENASFFKMDNISFGYNADHLFTEKLRARISLTVQNAFIVTKYSGIDPEVNNGTDPGVDNNIYPRPRTFVLGVNLTF
jgi:TonB-linked SusC/RagA family outer membrane protein